MPRSVSHVKPRRAKAIVMLISSKEFPTSLGTAETRSFWGNAGHLLELSYISAGRAQDSVIYVTNSIFESDFEQRMLRA